MTEKYQFYKTIGYELIEELATKFGMDVISGGSGGTYRTLYMDNGVSVRFTKRRNDEMPFYIRLFDKSNCFFELDLSMIVYSQGKFTWHLKVPSHVTNQNILNKWLGNISSFEDSYSDSVKEVKAVIKSGTNTPRTGYFFIKNSDWSEVCEQFLELMNKIVDAHTNAHGNQPVLKEAKDDDGPDSYSKQKVRRNQRQFRINLLSLYDYKCAISGECLEEVLEAAHIDQHSKSGINHTGNGVLLRSDLHRLFDKNLIGIDPASYKITIMPSLKGTSYEKFAGKKLGSRRDGAHPEQKYIQTKWEEAGFETRHTILP